MAACLHPSPPDPQPACLADALHAAQRADWAAAQLLPCLARLADWAGELDAFARPAWQVGLRRLLAQDGAALTPGDRRALMTLAAHWDDWPLVIAAGQAPGVADAAGVVTLLARAHWQLGAPEQALAVLQPWLVASPGDRHAYQLYRDITAWRDYRAAYPLTGADGELALEPLGAHHLNDFAWQYQDPAIARLCCLPEFVDDDHWLAWLQETHGMGDQLLYAVLHRGWGLVGSVSLILHRGVGFFYYWIGSAHQGTGLGPAAVALMLARAVDELGMHSCYAKVYADNYPSRRGLTKLGFAPLALRALPPDDDQCFYRAGPALPAASVVTELDTLLRDMDSEVRLAAPPLSPWQGGAGHGR